MGNEHEMPFELKLTLAVLSGDKNAVSNVIASCMDGVTRKLVDVAHSYHPNDLPFVVAGMRIVSSTLSQMMTDKGRELSDAIVNRTQCIAVDVEELKRQMKEGEE